MRLSNTADAFSDHLCDLDPVETAPANLFFGMKKALKVLALNFQRFLFLRWKIPSECCFNAAFGIERSDVHAKAEMPPASNSFRATATELFCQFEPRPSGSTSYHCR